LGQSGFLLNMFEPNFKKIISFILVIFFLFSFLPIDLAIAGSAPAEYLCEFGIQFYRTGRYDDALLEFKKALILDPDNKVAQQYIINIFEKEGPPITRQAKPTPQPIQQAVAPKQAVKGPLKQISRDEAMNLAFNNLGKKEEAVKKPLKEGVKKEEQKKPGIKITGTAQLSLGITPQDTVWKLANFDLNERFKSWRMTSDAAFNHQFNTYDPAIYDSLDLNLDSDNNQGFNFHTDITIDPWSFVGKSDKITLTGSNGDTAEMQMFYWSNTGYVVNDTAYTSLGGDSFEIPELKVRNGITDPMIATSHRNNAIFNIPSMKIEREFQPLRELWLDYANDQLKFRVFPMAYQNQAYSSDDPLGITNHNIWWKDSMWLRKYTPGNFNSQDIIPSYTKGRWDDALSFLAKDSTGRYLTALRGFSFSFQPQEETSFDTTMATPKDLWQDYGEVDNIISASRLKHYLTDNFMLGGTFTSRSGFITESKQKLDSQNFVAGMDLGYEITDGLKAQAEMLASKSFYDMNNSDYETEARGNTYYFSLISRYPQKRIMDLKYGYDEITMDKDESFLIKSKFYASRMDQGFDSALSDFHDTRQDTFWSRHIHFRKPLEYYYAGLNNPSTNWGELNSTRIGDGIDIGRNVLGFRFETFLKDRFSNLFDLRNVHKVGGKFVENVVRDEATVKLTDKLTAKALGIYQKLPKTTAGIDPFVYYGKTGEFFLNAAVPDAEDPTIKTGSLGLNYDFFDWLSVDGIYERTNDYTLAYGDFPRNVLRNDTTLFGTFYQDNKLYRFVEPFLYDQGLFPHAPYPFYNVFKCGLRLMPIENMELYLDYTRNEFGSASLISDNMNHVGMEVTYMPIQKIGMVFKYTYSRSQDLDRLRAGITAPVGHHNFFTEFRYLPSKDDELILEYGAGYVSLLNNVSSLDPYGGSLITLDTQHIVRMYYRKKF
jgi:hypothetical protein